MKNLQILLLLIGFGFLLQSFSCGRAPVKDCVGGYKNDTTFLKKFFAKDSNRHFVIANEYEDNFQEFTNCVYEIQILI